MITHSLLSLLCHHAINLRKYLEKIGQTKISKIKEMSLVSLQVAKVQFL